MTGVTDWKDTYGEERKVGLLHGLLMVLTTALFAVSLVFHLTGPWELGVIIGFVGYAFLSAARIWAAMRCSSFGYGVNHTGSSTGPTTTWPWDPRQPFSRASLYR